MGGASETLDQQARPSPSQLVLGSVADQGEGAAPKFSNERPVMRRLI